MTISITPLECGTLTAPMNNFESGASEDPIELPVPSWLIRTDKGIALVDSGLSTELATPGPFLDLVSNFFEVGLDENRSVGQQLRQVQVDPEDVDVVILTHLHFDHAGGLAQLPNARVIIQSAEWEAGESDEIAAASGYNPGDYRLGHDLVTIDGEHDVFGDGRVTCVPTPGHTVGHQSVRVRLESEEVVICGDCTYFERTLDGGALPPIGHDHEQQAKSITYLQGLRANGARMIPGHDSGVLAGLPKILS